MAPFHETWQEYYYSQAHRSRVVRARKERADWESRKRTEAREKLLRQATENDFHRRNEVLLLGCILVFIYLGMRQYYHSVN